MLFITLAGHPTAIIFSGISLVTTEPAPITALSPIVTPARTVDYKTTITFSAPGNIPDGATVHWIVNGKDVAQGRSYTNKSAISGYTVQSKVVDATGNVIAESEVETVTVNTGFFAKLIAFFRELFGLLPVIKQ